MAKKTTLVILNNEISPFSILDYIVVSQKDMEENGKAILTHELAHIQKRHSLDLIIADIFILLQWFNPGAWLIKRELRYIHEYEADKSVLEHGIDAKRYQLLLIEKAVGSQRFNSMANSFINHSKLKKRITMMLKENSKSRSKLKCLFILPAAALALSTFARQEISEQLNEISTVEVNDLTSIVEDKIVNKEISLNNNAQSANSGKFIYSNLKPNEIDRLNYDTIELNAKKITVITSGKESYIGGGKTLYLVDKEKKESRFVIIARGAGTGYYNPSSRYISSISADSITIEMNFKKEKIPTTKISYSTGNSIIYYRVPLKIEMCKGSVYKFDKFINSQNIIFEERYKKQISD